MLRRAKLELIYAASVPVRPGIKHETEQIGSNGASGGRAQWLAGYRVARKPCAGSQHLGADIASKTLLVYKC